MKEIKLYLKDTMLFKEIAEILLKEKIVENIIYNEEDILVQIDDSVKDNVLDFYYNLGIYLVIRYVRLENKKYPKKFQEEIEKAVCGANYFYGIMFIELVRYFQSNNILKENIFFGFNVKGFKEEISTIYQSLKYKEERDEFSKNFYEDLVKTGFKVEDYELLRVDYEVDTLKLINKAGDIITNKNVGKKLNIALKFDTSDKWLYDLAFCSTLCMMLRVKELIIPKEYAELYEDLIKYNDLESLGTKLILEE